MLLNGNDAIALGTLAAYPMTPATSIMEYMAAKARDLDLVVVQPEDEIAFRTKGIPPLFTHWWHFVRSGSNDLWGLY